MMQVNVISKSEIIIKDREALSVSFVTPKGEVTILDNHVRFISEINTGPLELKFPHNETLNFEILNGTALVEDNSVTLLITLNKKENDAIEENTEDLGAKAIQNAYELVSERGKNENYDYARMLGSLERELYNLRKELRTYK